jgi:hypothetical protein
MLQVPAKSKALHAEVLVSALVNLSEGHANITLVSRLEVDICKSASDWYPISCNYPISPNLAVYVAENQLGAFIL